MEGRLGTRRAFVAGMGTLAGALAAACATPQTSAPGQAVDYHGVTFQYTTKGSSAPAMADYQRVVTQLFEPAHPGVKVEFITEGADSYWVKLTALLAAGTPPDAAQQDDYYIATLASKGQLLELGPYQAKDKSFNQNDMFPGLWQAGLYRNKVYAISVAPFGPVVYYNKAHFDEAGLPYPPADYKQGGWTWNRMREDAKKLTKRDSSGQLTRAGFGWDARFLSRFSGHFFAYGTKMFDRLDDPTKCTLDDPLPTEFIQLLHDMRFVDRTAAPPEWYASTGDSRTKGLPGDNSAIFRDNRMSISIQLDDLAATRKTDLRWDYAPLPRANSTGKAGGFIGTNVYTAMKTTKYPQLAWDWISAMSSPTRAKWRMEDPDILAEPSWKSLASQYVKITPPDDIHVNLDLAEYGTSIVKSSIYPDLQDAVLNGLAPVWNNQAAVPQTVADVVRKVNDLLKQAPK